MNNIKPREAAMTQSADSQELKWNAAVDRARKANFQALLSELLEDGPCEGVDYDSLCADSKPLVWCCKGSDGHDDHCIYRSPVLLEAGAVSEPAQANYVAEIHPRPDDPSCHVCGAQMVPDGFKCLSCGTTTKPSESQTTPSESQTTPPERDPQSECPDNCSCRKRGADSVAREPLPLEDRCKQFVGRCILDERIMHVQLMEFVESEVARALAASSPSPTKEVIYRERLKKLAFLITGNDYAFLSENPQIEELLKVYGENAVEDWKERGGSPSPQPQADLLEEAAKIAENAIMPPELKRLLNGQDTDCDEVLRGVAFAIRALREHGNSTPEPPHYTRHAEASLDGCDPKTCDNKDHWFYELGTRQEEP